jgi:hypothetical protein
VGESNRLTDAKVLEDEGLDSDGAVTSKSKLQSKVKALSGVDILTATGEYKSTYEILSQISDVWKDISDIDQAALLELISGKRNSSVIAAILQSPEELKAAYDDAQNAEGSALKENEKYMDSIQGRIDQFNNATQTMWSNTLDDDVVKLIVNAGTALVKVVDKLGLVKTLVFGILTYMSVFKKNNLDFASILGIHEIQDGKGVWTLGKKGASKWVADKSKSVLDKSKPAFETAKDQTQSAFNIVKNQTQAAFGAAKTKSQSIKLPVSVDTSDIDQQIADVQRKLNAAKSQSKTIKLPVSADTSEIDAQIKAKKNEIKKLKLKPTRRLSIGDEVDLEYKHIKKYALEEQMANLNLSPEDAYQQYRSELQTALKYASSDDDKRFFEYRLRDDYKEEFLQQYARTGQNRIRQLEEYKAELQDVNAEIAKIEKKYGLPTGQFGELQKATDELDELKEERKDIIKESKKAKVKTTSVDRSETPEAKNIEDVKKLETELDKLKQKRKDIIKESKSAKVETAPVADTTNVADIEDINVLEQQRNNLLGQQELAQKKVNTAHNEFVQSLHQGSDSDIEAYSNQLKNANIELQQVNAQLSAVDAKIDAINAQPLDIQPDQAPKYQLDASQFANMKLEMPEVDDLAEVMDTINQKTSQGQAQLLDYFNTFGSGNEAIQAYIASLDGGQASLSGFNKFMQTHNAAVKTSGATAIAASVGHQILNAAISMGISLLISGAIALVTYIVKMADTTGRLAEELSDLNSEISDLKSEIDTLNTELETTSERMAELLALPSLTFVEQEELEKLQTLTDELERELAVKKELQDSKEDQQIRKQEEVVDDIWNSTGINKYFAEDMYGDGVSIVEDTWLNIDASDTKALLDNSLSEYETLQKKKQAALWMTEHKSDYYDGVSYDEYEQMRTIFGETQNMPEYSRGVYEFNNMGNNYSDDFINEKFEGIENALDNGGWDKSMDKYKNNIDFILSHEAFDNLEYGDSEKINTALDEMYAYRLRMRQIEGDSVKPEAISTMFDATATKKMQELGKTLQEIADQDISDADKNNQILDVLDKIDGTDDDAVNKIDGVTDAYNRLHLSMDKLGVTMQDIADYYVLDTGVFDSNTLDGVMKQYQRGVEVLEDFKDGLSAVDEAGTTYNWGDMFQVDDNGKFEAVEHKFGSLLKGMDKDAREAFMRVAESAKNSGKGIEEAFDESISSLTFEGLVATARAAESQWADINKNMFKNLDDGAISGWIDTFSELSAALEDVASSMDLLHDAQTQMNNSGRISIKTALEIIESTDNWNKILTITGDTITLTKDAEDQLIQSKLDVIKAQIDEALGAVDVQLAHLGAADSAYSAAMAADVSDDAYEQYTNAMNSYSASIAAFGAALDALLDDDKSTNVFSAFTSTYETAKKVTASSNDMSRVDRATLEQKQRDLQAQKDMMSKGGTVSGFKNYYDYDKTPGDKYSDSGSDGQSAFEQMQARHEHELAALEHEKALIQGDIDILEAQRKGVNSDYYKQLIAGEDKKINAYESQLEEAKALLAATSTTSEEYNDIVKYIWEIEEGIQEATLAAIEFGEAMNANALKQITDISDAYGNFQTINDRQRGSMDLYKEGVEIGGGFVNERWYDDMIAKAGEAGDLARKELQDSLNSIDLYRNLENPFEADTAEFEAWEYDRNVNLQEAWAKAADAKDKIREMENEALQLAEDKKDAYIEAWENVVTGFEHIGTLFENQISLIDGYESRLEALNINVADSVYEKKIGAQQSVLGNLDDAIAYDEKMLAEYATKYGKNDERYITKWEELNEKRVQRYEAETEIIELEQQIIDNQIDRFNQTIDRMNNAIDKMNNIKSLVSDEDVTDENGDWTAEGLTQAGMNFQEMAYQKEMIAAYADEMEELIALYEEGKISEKEYYEQMKELEDGQWAAIEAYKAAEDAIVELAEARIDIVEEALQEEIDAYAELIEMKKKELDAERDLFEFRRDVEDQSKNIAEIERRMASISNSSSDEDRAEYKRLQKELYDANRGLDDTYRNHSYDQTAQALDDELSAFENSYTDYIDRLRESLENTDELIKQIYSDVVTNGQLVLETLVQLSDEHGFTLDANLIAPWNDANGASLEFETAATEHYGNIKRTVELGTAGLVENITEPWKKGQEESQLFSKDAEKYVKKVLESAQAEEEAMTTTLKQPWLNAQSLIAQSPTWVTKAAGEILTIVKKNVEDINAEYAKITMLGDSTSGAGGSGSGGSGGGGGGGGGSSAKIVPPKETVKLRGLMQTSKEMILGPKSFVDSNTETINGIKYYRDSKTGYYYKISDLNSNRKYDGGRTTGWAIPKGTWFYTKYAKGTLGTKKDQWAITDEPQFGDELTLVPGKSGNLSFMRKGTGVVPADLTKRLMEIAQMPVNELGNNIVKAVVPNIETTNQAVQVNFEALVKADNITNDVLPEVEKLVEKQLNTFTKNLNYSLKKVGGR